VSSTVNFVVHDVQHGTGSFTMVDLSSRKVNNRTLMATGSFILMDELTNGTAAGALVGG
jgi:hypothetical protein